MYTKLDIIVIIICAVIFIGAYIGLKASGELSFGINWKKCFYEIRRAICKLLLKLFNK